VIVGGLDGLEGQVAVRRWVVGVCTVVAVDSHLTVTLVGVESAEGSVHRDLLVVDAKTVAVCVRIGEQARLKNWVG